MSCLCPVPTSHRLLLAAALVAALPFAASAEPADVAPLVPLIPNRTFHLERFGAKPDGRSSNTEVFTRAVAAVQHAGGGTLEVPAGVYLTGPFTLGDGINLRLDRGAEILFSPRTGDYAPQGNRLEPELSIVGRHDVMISGSGTFDGNGGVWWPAARALRDPVTGRQYEGHTTPRPPMIVFSGCERVRVEGVTLRNSPALNLGFVNSREISADGLTILNPADSPNTDGIDPKGCRRVLIKRCRIDTGDDCIAAGGGPGLEEDILIANCTFLHGHGCSIGSGTIGGVRNFTVRDCTFDGTDTGIRLKSARGRGGLVESVTYEDLVLRRVGHAISINSDYQGTTTDVTVVPKESAEPVTPTTPAWRSIVIRNVRSLAGREDAGLIAGLPEMPVENVVLDNVVLQAPRGLTVVYARNIILHNVSLQVAAGPAIIRGDGVEHLVRAD